MYQIINANLVRRVSDGASIPLPPAESEGFKYAAWLAAGNTPLAADPPPLVDWRTPLAVDLTARRDRLMIVCDGLYNDYNERGDLEHRKLAYHFKQRLKGVTPTHPDMLATTDEAQYRAAAKALYNAAIAAAVLDTWPGDPGHAIPLEVKTEFKRYAP